MLYSFVVITTFVQYVVCLIYQKYEKEPDISNKIIESRIDCPYFKYGPNLDVRDLVGSWMAVYAQPKFVNCFTVVIRATTEMERERYSRKYGNFGGRVDWSKCFLEVETDTGKHFFQGNGSNSGVLENIVFVESRGKHELQEQTADQWTMYGARGSELLLMRDCAGEAMAVFARTPYWPTADDLFAILHRSGIGPRTKERTLCEPLNRFTRHCYVTDDNDNDNNVKKHLGKQ